MKISLHPGENKLLKFLNKDYPKYNTGHKPWENGFFGATVVLFIFLLLQPFGFKDKDPILKWILFPAYSLLAYFYSIINFFIVRHILKSKKKWSIANELSAVVIGVIPFTLLVLLLTSWIAGDMPLNLHWYFMLLYHVSSLFLTIRIIEFFYYSNKNSNIEINQLASQFRVVSQKLDNVKASNIETVSISLEKEYFDIDRNKLIFIKSIGNYLEFYFRETNGDIKKLVKRGRIHHAEKVLETFPEFLRCHRAFIVNLKQAKQMKGKSKNARLAFDQKLEEIPVSRSQFKTLKEQLDKIIAC